MTLPAQIPDGEFTDWAWMIRALRPKMREALNRIAIGDDTCLHPASAAALEKRGLVAGYDAIWHGVRIRRYEVPIPIHIAWCAVCSEEIEARRK